MAHPADDPTFRMTKTGSALRVRITPRASHDRITTVDDTAGVAALTAYVRAPATKGAANRALIALVANWFEFH